MADSVQHYISSGILEAYVVGSLSEPEEQEVMRMRKEFPAVREALNHLEADMEALAMQMAIPPPPALWGRIEDSIDGLIKTQEAEVIPFRNRQEQRQETHNRSNEPHFIEVEAQSSHMKIHKAWRWVFAAVFVLGKIFLATAIYFYIENRHNQQQVQELKTQLQQLQQVQQLKR
ncbi:hypothetical protein GCM10027037_08970 [Mucilaginibacter koreensis]